jgi:hypothetical protein
MRHSKLVVLPPSWQWAQEDRGEYIKSVGRDSPSG